MFVRFGFLLLSMVMLPALAVAEERSYEVLVAEGLQEFELAHWEEARMLFERAHAVEPSARTLRGLGMVAFELRHYVECVRLLEASLTEQVDALPPDLRAQVDELLVRARTFVGRVRLRLSPTDAALTVDEGPARREADGSMLLETGEHVLVANTPGYQEKRRTIDLRGGQTLDLSMTLSERGGATPAVAVAAAPTPAPATTAAPAAAVAPDTAPRDDDGSVFGKWWFWTAAGAVVAGAVIGVVAATAEDDVRDPEPGTIGRIVPALGSKW